MRALILCPHAEGAHSSLCMTLTFPPLVKVHFFSFSLPGDRLQPRAALCSAVVGLCVHLPLTWLCLVSLCSVSHGHLSEPCMACPESSLPDSGPHLLPAADSKDLAHLQAKPEVPIVEPEIFVCLFVSKVEQTCHWHWWRSQ